MTFRHISGVLRFFLFLSVNCWSVCVYAQAITSATATDAKLESSKSQNAETTSLVHFIIHKQNENYDRMKSYKGDMVCTINDFQTTPISTKRYFMSFAANGDDSILMIVPWLQNKPIPSRWEKPESWKDAHISVISNNIITYNYNKDDKLSLKDEVYSQEKFGRNLFYRFHPRLFGEYKESIADSLKNADITLVNKKDANSTNVIYLDFFNIVNDSGIRYTIRTDKGYLPEKIMYYQNEQPCTLINIVIGTTSDGLFIPAKYDCVVFGDNAEPIMEEQWHYNYLSMNHPVPPLELTGVAAGIVDLTKLLDKSPATTGTHSSSLLKDNQLKTVNKNDADI